MHWIYLIHEFHNLSWITEINELFHDILIYWDAPVYQEGVTNTRMQHMINMVWISAEITVFTVSKSWDCGLLQMYCQSMCLIFCGVNHIFEETKSGGVNFRCYDKYSMYSCLGCCAPSLDEQWGRLQIYDVQNVGVFLKKSMALQVQSELIEIHTFVTSCYHSNVIQLFFRNRRPSTDCGIIQLLYSVPCLLKPI